MRKEILNGKIFHLELEALLWIIQFWKVKMVKDKTTLVEL